MISAEEEFCINFIKCFEGVRKKYFSNKNSFFATLAKNIPLSTRERLILVAKEGLS
jgi:hypothetical protein